MQRRAGVEDERAGRLGRRDTVDRRPAVDALRIARRRQHDGHRRAAARARRDPPARSPRAAAASTSRRSPSMQRQHGLRLGVAEAAVELEHLRPSVGEHQPREEQARRTASRAAPAPRATGCAPARRAARRRVVESRRPAHTRPCRRCWGRCRRRRRACSPAPARAATRGLAVADARTARPRARRAAPRSRAGRRASSSARRARRRAPPACGRRRRPCPRPARRP